MRFIQATRIFSGKEFFKDNSVLIINDNGTVKDLVSADAVEKSNIEHIEGIITPGFINTHCHLELSHLKDKIKRHTGIVDFGLSVIKYRNDIPAEMQQEYMLQADKEMLQQGIVAVGDISNTILSLPVKKQSTLYYHTFVELIGLNPERAELVFDAGKEIINAFEENDLSASLAPHASYSSSLELIKKITDSCYLKNKPTSIHNQESKAENDFFKTKTGNYLSLYEALGLPISYFKPTGKSSLQSVLPAFNKEVRVLLVHNTFTDADDIKTAQNEMKHVYWCLCPKANLYIENTLPDVTLLSKSKCVLTLGTDSLASNSNVSVMDEINCLQLHRPDLSLELLLQAATYNGAEFLGIENKFGLLKKGNTPGINVIDITKKGNYSVKKLAQANRRG